jgi:hypothetical protein
MAVARIGKGFSGRPGKTSAATGLLTAADFTYLGAYRMPANDTHQAYGGMTGRTVDGRDRLFVYSVKDLYGAKGTVTAASSGSQFTVAFTAQDSIYATLGTGDVINVYLQASTDPAESTVIQNVSGSYPNLTFTVNPALSEVPVTRVTTTVATGASTTSMTIASAAGLAIGDSLLVQRQLTDTYDTTRITNLVGTTVTMSPAVGATPVTGGAVIRNGSVVFRTDDPIMEVEIPLSAPTASYVSAPMATKVALWPDPYRGKRLTWRLGGGEWQYDNDSNAPNHVYPVGLYWHADNNLLYWTFYSTYNVTNEPDWQLGASALGAPSVVGGSDGSVTAYGPWRTSHLDRLNQTFYGPARFAFLSKRPNIQGDMLGGGVTRSGIHSTVWGPTCWGRSTFPNIDTPGGFSATTLTTNDRYLEYYYPVAAGPMDVATGNRINKDGTFNQAITSYQHTKPTGYSDIFEEDYDTPRSNVDPGVNSGIASWRSFDASTGLLWFDDGNKYGVLFTAILALSSDTSSASEGAAHVFYRNEHQYSIHMDPESIVGTFINGEVYEGQTSGATINAADATATMALSKVQGGHTPAVVQNFVVGETLKGLTSLAEGEISVIHRHNVCSHGFDETVTGDFSTHAFPAIMIFDPVRLESNKALTTTDYTTQASTVIDLTTTFGIESSPTPGGNFRHIAGFYFNPTSRRLYCISHAADITSIPGSFQTIIHVFQVAA